MSHYDGQLYLRQLIHKAMDYMNDSPRSGYERVEFFYRCKSDEYFREVKRNNNVMEPIMKDFNGDPKSPINGNIRGVFLGVDLFNWSLPTAPPFGDVRVAFPIRGIFTERTNMYFADFYCTVSNYHYVTLVLTTVGSPADNFCYVNLPKIHPLDNPFLRTNGSKTEVVKKQLLHVEVFYTEKVDLNDLTKRFGSNNVFFENIVALGKGCSTLNGLKKKLNCLECNPTIHTPTSSLSTANFLLESRNPPKLTYERPVRQVQARIFNVHSFSALEVPKPIIQARPPKRSLDCISLQEEPAPAPWWLWLTKWRIWLVSAVICAALYLTIM